MSGKEAEELVHLLAVGGYGTLGGLALYLNQVRKGRKFNLSMFAINLLLAGFIGWLVDGVLPDDIQARNQFIAISGFLAYPILDLIEEKGFNYLVNKYLGAEKK